MRIAIQVSIIYTEEKQRWADSILSLTTKQLLLHMEYYQHSNQCKYMNYNQNSEGVDTEQCLVMSTAKCVAKESVRNNPVSALNNKQ